MCVCVCVCVNVCMCVRACVFGALACVDTQTSNQITHKTSLTELSPPPLPHPQRCSSSAFDIWCRVCRRRLCLGWRTCLSSGSARSEKCWTASASSSKTLSAPLLPSALHGVFLMLRGLLLLYSSLQKSTHFFFFFASLPTLLFSNPPHFSQGRPQQLCGHLAPDCQQH